ncbi:hypothetical protein SAMN06296416_102521 [Pseudoxanthomonas wuyuanensis]|uniref:Uncharacterized protein n=1 Tax=Pseudoxanthomonas wuyuanensis TaxID=1073196 RepID=A0A286D4S6_9GAMM|nr:hypothetical protein SAMN06296416_102521 [Pseudoxanthomonas wuyuanensis]
MVTLILIAAVALLVLGVTFAALAPVYRRIGNAVHGKRTR